MEEQALPGEMGDVYLQTEGVFLAYKIVPHILYGRKAQVCVRVSVRCDSVT